MHPACFPGIAHLSGGTEMYFGCAGRNLAAGNSCVSSWLPFTYVLRFPIIERSSSGKLQTAGCTVAQSPPLQQVARWPVTQETMVSS